MEQLEYLLGNILSHIWGCLNKLFGFWKPQYTRPSLFGTPFLADIQNWETPIAKLWKKLVWRNYGSPRVSPWDHFKPYLRLFGPVVWILEISIYSSATFRGTIFGRYPNLREAYCKILKKKMFWGILKYLLRIIASYIWAFLNK